MTEAHRTRLLDLVDAFPEQRVLVVGDVMLDEYLHGAVERVSPEAPVPVVDFRRREVHPGGAANVARNARHLGAEVSLVGLVGEDEGAQTLREALAGEGIRVDGLTVCPSRRTTRKVRVVSSGQQLLRVDTEDAHPSTADEGAHLRSAVARELEGPRPPRVIVLEDYDKGVLSEALISWITREAKAREIPTVVDPKRRNFWHYHGVDLFKPNLKEVRGAMPSDWAAEGEGDEIQGLAGAVRARLACRAVLVTLGAGGAAWESEDDYLREAAHPRDVADVCGAGDSVVTTAALALAAGAEAAEVLALANLAGGLVCEYAGVRPLPRKELKRGVERC